MNRLIHYSSAPITVLRPVDFKVHPNGKPKGLWLSVEGEDDWKSWCEAEDFRLENLAVEHEVILKPDANILKLSTSWDIDDFTERYGESTKWSVERKDINWMRVADEYQGIIIAPYVWSRRMAEHTFWYYGWDCASGCVWDTEAVNQITVLGP